MGKCFGNTQRRFDEDFDVLDQLDSASRLIVYNDDFNTFDFVIESLIQVCHHTPQQAEQCTVLIHYKGKCIVKQGAVNDLQPMHSKLISRGITSEIMV